MPALRSFRNYTNTAPVQPTIWADALLATSAVPLVFACKLTNVDGYVSAAGYFQMFDSTVAPQANDVPLKSIPCLAAGNLPSWAMMEGPVSFNKGVYFAMSSTHDKYTAVGTTFDVWGEIDEFEIQDSGTSVLGDLSSSVSSLVLQTAASQAAAGPYKIHKIWVQNNAAQSRYFQLHLKQTPQAGDKPYRTLQFIVNEANPYPRLNAFGETFFNGAAGMCVVTSTTLLTYTSPGANDCYIMALVSQ